VGRAGSRYAFTKSAGKRKIGEGGRSSKAQKLLKKRKECKGERVYLTALPAEGTLTERGRGGVDEVTNSTDASYIRRGKKGSELLVGQRKHSSHGELRPVHKDKKSVGKRKAPGKSLEDSRRIGARTVFPRILFWWFFVFFLLWLRL